MPTIVSPSRAAARASIVCGLFVPAVLGTSVASALEEAAPKPSVAARRLVGETPVVFSKGGARPEAVTFDQDLGTSDFTVGLSVRADEPATEDLGDLLSLWNPKTRHGFSLGLRNNTGCTSSQPNWRQLQFGVDAGTEPSWRDEGRPGQALLGFAMAVHDGSLFVGTCEPGPDQAGKVYRYAGPGRWEDMGRLDGANSVTALATYRGQLYAGTGRYLLRGSSLPESENSRVGGKVYRFVGPGRWELVGDLAPTPAVAAFVTYNDRLYASSLYAPAGFFRYEGGTEWTSIPTPGGKRVQALAVHDGAVYATSYDGGKVYRFDGSQWTDLGAVGVDNSQTYSFATYQNKLHVGTWPSGKVFRLDAGNRWADAGRLGQELEVMAALVHNGVFYAGSLPRADVFRYEGGERWTPLKQLDTTPDVRFRRVWTMATYKGRLFATTLPSGIIWSMNAGACVTDDRELPKGWHDVVAQRTQGRLRLFVDGRLVAESEPTPAKLALDTKGLSLTLGDGPRGQFVGQLRNVWLDVAPAPR